MNREVLEAARKLEMTASLDAVWQAMRETCVQFKIGDFIYNTMADVPPDGEIIYSTLAGRWPQGGRESAEKAGEEWFNPFLAYCCATFEPTCVGSEFLPVHDYVGTGSKAFIMRARALGVTAALAMPTRLTGTGRHGGFVLCTGYDRFRFEREILPRAGDLHMLCLIAHRRIEDLWREGTSRIRRNPLSVRERQTLALAAKGMRAKEVAHILSVSEASVRLYQKNARSKLGARTMEEAVAIALRDDGLLITGLASG